MGESTPRSSALTRLGRIIEHAAAILFARSDARARSAGWDVSTTGRCRTSRVYHDPRYDRLARCPRCAGAGCGRCAGTGRIVRRPTAPGPRGTTRDTGGWPAGARDVGRRDSRRDSRQDVGRWGDGARDRRRDSRQDVGRWGDGGGDFGGRDRAGPDESRSYLADPDRVRSRR